MSRPIPKPKYLTPELVLRAYTAGIFPMSESRDDSNIFWVDPKLRGIIPLNAFHVSRRLQKTIRQNIFEVRCNTAFNDVILECAASSKGRNDTWINDEIIGAYSELHELGFVHSIECWQDDKLAGGLYGIALGGGFFGESMFSRVRDASKVALVNLVARLKLGGFVLLDTQFVTDHLKQFGAIEIPARDYMTLLAEALDMQATFYGEPDGVEGFDGKIGETLEALFRQSKTQTS
ncbi:MAG: leucyl/phenylalanyl-tRNA--protein transferase [Rhodospirillaceae bacterium]|jgi:leucyl/phenylalanyl-tRNA--protein transferase